MKEVMKELNLPKEVAEECFLFEAIDYLLTGYPPQEDCQYGDYNARYSHDLYCEGIDNFPQNEEFITGLFHKKYNIENCPYDNIKYEDINHYSSFESFEERYGRFGLNSDNQELLSDINKKRELLKEFLPQREEYEKKIRQIINPFEKNLIEKLKSGEIKANGLLVYKYCTDEEKFLEIYDDWCSIAIRQEINYKTGEYCKPQYYEDEKLERVSIPKEYWIYENVDFDESSLEFKIGNDRYKYLFILIDFEDIFKCFPQKIEMDINASLIGDKIIYDNKEYVLNNENSTRGRKPLEWDLFYTELFRYTFKDCKGELPCKQYSLIDHMQQWCKKNLKAGSYGSIQGRIKKIYDSLKSQKIEK